MRAVNRAVNATLVAVASTLTLGACATVDMTTMGGGAPAMVKTADSNVVETATARLFALFSSKGWSTLDSRKKMRSAATVLLEGLDAKTLSTDPSPYVAAVADRDILGADMREATYHVEQTLKAAEVFLAMTSPGQDIRTEASDLEQALLASRQAEKVFGEAAARVGDVAEMEAFAVTVDRLRDVTDEFGRRVRRAGEKSVVSAAAWTTL